MYKHSQISNTIGNHSHLHPSDGAHDIGNHSHLHSGNGTHDTTNLQVHSSVQNPPEYPQKSRVNRNTPFLSDVELVAQHRQEHQ
jgi:hypothetical protein